ncbi:hypothetical protein [Comamonas sp.]|uniref:hypothetical protein n=1 Tax=Comamonas sp. TaxID=34028 RepID=UPI00289937D5|nr:hypothetical protein [Comamonas sp.]
MPTTKPHSYWQQRRELIAEQVKTMTAKDFAKAHDCTVGAARNILNKLGLRTQPDTWQQHAQALAADAQTMTYQQIAAKWDRTAKSMHTTLRRLGITAQHTKRTCTPKPQLPVIKQQTKAARPTPARNNPKPLLAVTPSRASIASKAPAQIIWPEHVQIQRIPLATPPAHAPICAGTARGTYKPSSDWYRSPRAM